jgi:hypothetical protein
VFQFMTDVLETWALKSRAYGKKSRSLFIWPVESNADSIIFREACLA